MISIDYYFHNTEHFTYDETISINEPLKVSFTFNNLGYTGKGHKYFFNFVIS